ncbi:MAG: hypothetical protein ABSF50_17205 [Burkholderiaceae bacterium]
MQKHHIYAKSAKGNDGVATHPHRLAARYRRFLALVDGKRSVAELETVARPEEITETLSFLITNGFIEKIGERNHPEGAASKEDPFLAASMTPDMFEEFKRRAVLQLDESFGIHARLASERISQASTPAALRAALRESERMMLAQQPKVDSAAVRALFLRIGRNFV